MTPLDPRPPLPYCIDLDDKSAWVITKDRNGFPRRELPAMAALLHSAGRQTPNVRTKIHYTLPAPEEIPALVRFEGEWSDGVIDLTGAWRTP